MLAHSPRQLPALPRQTAAAAAMDSGDAPLLEVEQDNGAPAQPALRTRGAGGSSNDEDEWQMVTPGGSPRGSQG